MTVGACAQPTCYFCPITTMAWTCPYLAILTSAATPYREAKGNDAKAKILAATVRDIMAKAQEHCQALPDDLKKVCLHAFVCFTHSADSANVTIHSRS